MSGETAAVRVLITFGDQADIVADVPPEEREEPVRYPAEEIAQAVGVPVLQLAGMRLLADVGPGDRLRNWRRNPGA